MKLSKVLLCMAFVCSPGVLCQADTVVWNIDSSQSLIRMTIPDQDIDIGGGTTIFAGLRGAQPIFDVTPGATNPPVVPWSDDRGAAAAIQGTLTSDYEEGVSISFTQGTHNATLVESGQWIPNRNKARQNAVTGLQVVSEFQLTNGGSGYSSAEAVSPTGGTGSGLVINTTADESGVIQGVTIVQSGTGYSPNNVLTIPGGNGNATLQVINNGGSGYVSANNVLLTGGSGAGARVNITANASGVIIGVTPVFNSGGSNYSANDLLTVPGGNGNATLRVSQRQWQFDFHKPEIEGHPAAFVTELTLGGLIRVGHVSLYNIELYADGVATLSGGGPTWTQSGGALTLGGAAGSILDLWAQILAPSSRTTSGSSIGLNNGTMTIEDLGGNQRKLTISLDIDFVLLVSGLPLQNSKFTGQIVAFADVTPAAQVVDSFVYHGGYGGGGSPIDTGKVVAKEGSGPQALGYDNLINTSRGVNGLVFDIQGLGNGAALSSTDFEVQVSPTGAFDAGANPPSGWGPGPNPSSVTVTPGSPDRVLIQWPNNSIVNRWLRLTILANANTGLADPETYYVGHLLGETTGLSGSAFTVSLSDVTPIRVQSGQIVDASSIADIDKNGTVSAADISAMRVSVGSQLSNITIP